MLANILPWQQTLWQQMVNNPNPAHAYLLHGQKGIGKSIFVKQLSHFWLCLKPVDNKPCGQCKSCHLLVSSGAHPDVFYLSPEDSEFIKVDQVRELIHFVNQTPQLSRCKVIVIEPAEALNINAANALLKSLEEPAGNTRILLLSHQTGQLLATIKSRCIKQLCPTPNKELALSWINEQLPDLDGAQQQLLWQLAGCTPLYAVELYEQGILEQRQKVVDDIKKLIKRQLLPSQVAEQWDDTKHKDGIALLLLLNWFCDWLHHIQCYVLTHNKEDLGMEDMQKVLGYLAEKAPASRILELQNWLLSQRQKILAKANLNRVLLIETLLIHWINLPTTG